MCPVDAEIVGPIISNGEGDASLSLWIAADTYPQGSPFASGGLWPDVVVIQSRPGGIPAIRRPRCQVQRRRRRASARCLICRGTFSSTFNGGQAGDNSP